MDEMNNAKFWKCKNQHALGMVQRVQVSDNGNSRWATRLVLFRQALDVDEAAEVDVIANIEGTTTDIRCSVCGEIRTWWIGEAATERLMERMGLKLISDKSPE